MDFPSDSDDEFWDALVAPEKPASPHDDDREKPNFPTLSPPPHDSYNPNLFGDDERREEPSVAKRRRSEDEEELRGRAKRHRPIIPEQREPSLAERYYALEQGRREQYWNAYNYTQEQAWHAYNHELEQARQRERIATLQRNTAIARAEAERATTVARIKAESKARAEAARIEFYRARERASKAARDAKKKRGDR